MRDTSVTLAKQVPHQIFEADRYRATASGDWAKTTFISAQLSHLQRYTNSQCYKYTLLETVIVFYHDPDPVFHSEASTRKLLISSTIRSSWIRHRHDERSVTPLLVIGRTLLFSPFRTCCKWNEHFVKKVCPRAICIPVLFGHCSDVLLPSDDDDDRISCCYNTWGSTRAAIMSADVEIYIICIL